MHAMRSRRWTARRSNDDVLARNAIVGHSHRRVRRNRQRRPRSARLLCASTAPRRCALLGCPDFGLMRHTTLLGELMNRLLTTLVAAMFAGTTFAAIAQPAKSEAPKAVPATPAVPAKGEPTKAVPAIPATPSAKAGAKADVDVTASTDTKA